MHSIVVLGCNTIAGLVLSYFMESTILFLQTVKQAIGKLLAELHMERKAQKVFLE